MNGARFVISAALILSAVLPSQAQTVVTHKAEVVYPAGATTGEGSIWHPSRQSLFWVDIEGQTLYEYAPGQDKDAIWSFDRMVSTVVPETDSTVVIALQNEIARVNLNDGSVEPIAVIPDNGGSFRTNDGKCDPEGRMWVGTMRFRGRGPSGEAALYCVQADGTTASKVTGVTISNGIVWSHDHKFMYYVDTPTGLIARYNYNAQTGEIGFDKIAVKIPVGSGAPDGMTIDRDGNLWVAQWGGYGVYCYDPNTGALLAKVEVPAPNVASCTFGGKDMDELYITTASAGLSWDALKKYPLSGSVFLCKPGVTGVTANYFRK